MAKKSERFELRLTKQELSALDKLVKRNGFEYRAEWIADKIQKTAKRQRVWDD